MVDIFHVIDENAKQMFYITIKDVESEPSGADSAMLNLRSCTFVIAIVVASAPAFAKNETLAERGKRMCEEAGVALEDCTILPPALRNSIPNTDLGVARSVTPIPNAEVAVVRPVPRPLPAVSARPSTFGTGKYGWCEDCTSLLAAAPVTPWSEFSGRQYEPLRDEDDRSSSRDRSASRDDRSTDSGDTDSDDDNDNGDNGNDDNGTDNGDDDNGTDDDNSDNDDGGEICD